MKNLSQQISELIAENVPLARRAGEAAFRRGAIRSPALDDCLMDLLNCLPCGSGGRLENAWLAGWDAQAVLSKHNANSGRKNLTAFKRVVD